MEVVAPTTSVVEHWTHVLRGHGDNLMYHSFLVFSWIGQEWMYWNKSGDAQLLHWMDNPHTRACSMPMASPLPLDFSKSLFFITGLSFLIQD